MNVTTVNTRSALGKARQLSGLEWAEVLAQYDAGRGMARSSEGRAFTRAEVEFLLPKLGRHGDSYRAA